MSMTEEIPRALGTKFSFTVSGYRPRGGAVVTVGCRTYQMADIERNARDVKVVGQFHDGDSLIAGTGVSHGVLVVRRNGSWWRNGGTSLWRDGDEWIDAGEYRLRPVMLGGTVRVSDERLMAPATVTFTVDAEIERSGMVTIPRKAGESPERHVPSALHEAGARDVVITEVPKAYKIGDLALIKPPTSGIWTLGEKPFFVVRVNDDGRWEQTGKLGKGGEPGWSQSDRWVAMKDWRDESGRVTWFVRYGEVLQVE